MDNLCQKTLETINNFYNPVVAYFYTYIVYNICDEDYLNIRQDVNKYCDNVYVKYIFNKIADFVYDNYKKTGNLMYVYTGYYMYYAIISLCIISVETDEKTIYRIYKHFLKYDFMNVFRQAFDNNVSDEDNIKRLTYLTKEFFNDNNMPQFQNPFTIRFEDQLDIPFNINTCVICSNLIENDEDPDDNTEDPFYFLKSDYNICVYLRNEFNKHLNGIMSCKFVDYSEYYANKYSMLTYKNNRWEIIDKTAPNQSYISNYTGHPENVNQEFNVEFINFRKRRRF